MVITMVENSYFIVKVLNSSCQLSISAKLLLNLLKTNMVNKRGHRMHCVSMYSRKYKYVHEQINIRKSKTT